MYLQKSFLHLVFCVKAFFAYNFLCQMFIVTEVMEKSAYEYNWHVRRGFRASFINWL